MLAKPGTLPFVCTLVCEKVVIFPFGSDAANAAAVAQDGK